MLPSFSDLASGKLSASDLKDLDIDDLLGRVPVLPNTALMEANVLNKVVMVTGAGGSIGSELCRQIIALHPSLLILVEQSEFALYSIQEELDAYISNEHSNCKVTALLASVVDEDRMRNIFRAQHVHTVFHAAAYKHVPLVESNPFEGIKNNIFGTLSMVRVAKEFSVENFVLISTDKAVRPTNIMGATKRFAELILQAYDKSVGGSATIFSMVRFGNVLGSSGSVVPKFRQQIKSGGPVTLTHNEVTRYFMTIPEAAQLVIQASAMAVGGDVFVLDMGEPIKIRDLAENMINLSGLTLRDEHHPDGDIEIQVLGLRPGEKLYEELLIGNNPEKTAHERILRAHEDHLDFSALMSQLAILDLAVKQQLLQQVKVVFQEVVSGYSSTTQLDS
jgi:FlaA1/EpsC-like NDP-sugar epimerase